MGKLEDLERGLYGKDDEEIRRRSGRRVLFPKSVRNIPQVWQELPKQIGMGEGIKQSILNRKFLKIFFGGVGILALIMGSVFLFFYLGTRGQEAEVTIHDRGTVSAGGLVTIPITFRNTSSTSLKEVELTVVLPAGSIIVEEGQERSAPSRIVRKVEDLDPAEEGSAEIAAKLFGKEGEEKEILATLTYRPENLRARFSAKSSRNFMIGAVPLAIVWEVPEKFSSNQEVQAVIRYNSSASFPFRNMWLRVEYPFGFNVVSSSVKPTEGNNIWNIGDLDPGEEGSIQIAGKITGEEGEIKSFIGALGVFNPLTKEWRAFQESALTSKIAVAPLSITGLLNGSREPIIDLGENLEFALHYKNNTEKPLRNITLRARLEGSVLDLPTLQIDKGTFDSGTNSIVWSSAIAPELRELAPGQGGEFKFEVEIKARPAIRGAGDKNQIVRLNAEISPAFVPEEFSGAGLTGRDLVEAKVRTKILFSAKALHASSPILTSGPIPPRVGSETVYTILWEVRNFTNDIDGVQVVGILPPNVTWKNVFSPKDSRVVFDSATSEVRWNVGKVPAGTGINSPALTMAFQVSVTPSQVDRGKTMTLVTESQFSGKDSFVKEDLQEKIGNINTDLRDEPGGQVQDGVVK